MDQPMDVGYSFTENEAGYVNTGIATAPNLYKFLLQFFQLFPEIKDNDFYNSGVSFGDIYAPAAAHYIHIMNKGNPAMKINLKGLILETPLSDPISQVNYGEYLYHVGLIEDNDRVYFAEQSSIVKQLINEEKYKEAQDINLRLLGGPSSYFSNKTGYAATFNILTDTVNLLDYDFATYAETKEFREAVHVGNLTFNFVSQLVQNLLRPNMLRSVKPLIEELLDAGYKVLIYGGNVDIATYHLGLDIMIKSFQWNGAQEYSKASREIWRFGGIGGSVAGYTKSARNFKYALVRNAGHGASSDQPVWVLDLVSRFTKSQQVV